jgi:hypothetical protein
LRNGFIFERQPEFSDLLIAPHEIDPIDPKRRVFGGLTCDLDDRKLRGMNPDFPREQIGVVPLRSGLHDEAVIAIHILFTEQIKGVVIGADLAIVAVAPGRGFDFTLHQGLEDATADQP